MSSCYVKQCNVSLQTATCKLMLGGYGIRRCDKRNLKDFDLANSLSLSLPLSLYLHRSPSSRPPITGTTERTMMLHFKHELHKLKATVGEEGSSCRAARFFVINYASIWSNSRKSPIIVLVKQSMKIFCWLYKIKRNPFLPTSALKFWLRAM